MTSKRSALLAVCLAALGLMAFSASAQAATWMVNGNNVDESMGLLHWKVTAAIVGPSADLLTIIKKVDIKILCQAGTLVNASLLPNGVVSPGGSVRFTICSLWANELKGAGWVEQEACEPLLEEGAQKGVVETEPGKGQLGLHETEGVTVIEAETGGAEGLLATVQTGEECAFGEAIPIYGKLAIVDSEGMGGLLSEQATHTIKEETALTKLYVISDTPEHKATITGEAEVKLEEGGNWSGLPE